MELGASAIVGGGVSLKEGSIEEGESPIHHPNRLGVRQNLQESRSLRLERKSGGRFHPKQNRSSRPLANKYHEGKVKRTLERGLKVSELAEEEANGTYCEGKLAAQLGRAWSLAAYALERHAS